LSAKFILALCATAMLMVLAAACGDGQGKSLNLEDCEHKTRQIVDFLDQPVPVASIEPDTHLQGFDFVSCVSDDEFLAISQNQDFYNAFEIVIEEAKGNTQGFSSQDEMEMWFLNRLDEVMKESYSATFKWLENKKAERDFAFYFDRIEQGPKQQTY